MSILFRIAGFATLLFDGYLLLSMIALTRMSREYHPWLPPLGWDNAKHLPNLAIMMFVLWTGVLAIGCIMGHRGTGTASMQEK